MEREHVVAVTRACKGWEVSYIDNWPKVQDVRGRSSHEERQRDGSCMSEVLALKAKAKWLLGGEKKILVSDVFLPYVAHTIASSLPI